RAGLNVVAEFGHHEGHSRPLGILADCARRLAGLPVLFVGVRCPVETIMARIRAGQPGRSYEAIAPSGAVPEPVRRYTEAVHDPGLYDMEVDSARMTAVASAEAIREKLETGVPRPTAFERLANSGTGSTSIMS
ncbi:MAG: chloramphenicol phosphotransferase, partial [Hyphomicrobiales bacterium]|nr:chloramphenicol phosphotransferase [Hyphomicrobiales bacterium]